MRVLRFVLLALAAAGYFLTGLVVAPLGAAAGSCPHRFGAAQQLPDAGGGTQEWTVTGLKKSAAVLPGYSPTGQLWEAAATVRAARGTITPLIPGLAAHAKGGHYPVLWQIATDQGLPGSTLDEGQTSSGTLYFDVTGPDPQAVVYTADPSSPTAMPAMMWCCEGSMTMTTQMKTQMKDMMKDCPCCQDMPASAPGGRCPCCG